eukprot:Nk52_evm2s213 gene=Nk52_evmTU2s213
MPVNNSAKERDATRTSTGISTEEIDIRGARKKSSAASSSTTRRAGGGGGDAAGGVSAFKSKAAKKRTMDETQWLKSRISSKVKYRKKSLRDILFDFFYEHRSTARFYLRLRIAFDLLSVIFYVMGRSFENSNDCCFVNRPFFIYIVQTIVAWSHVFDLSMRFYLTKNNLRIFDIDLIMWIDFILGIPFLMGMFWPRIQDFYVPSFLRSWTALANFHTLLFQKDMKDRKLSYFYDELVFLVSTLTCLVLNGACGINYIETVSTERDGDLSMYEAFWFIVVTYSTVGYGDITPESWEGKFFVMFLIILILIILPSQLDALLAVTEQRNSDGGAYLGEGNHVVVSTSTLAYTTTTDLLSEMFSGHHEYDSLDVVLLDQNHNLHHHLFLLLTTPVWQQRVSYLRGSVLVPDDLYRVKMRSAKACFLLPNRGAGGMAEADAETVVSAWAVKEHSPSTELFVMLYLPENRYKVDFAEHVVCAMEIEYGFFSMNCHYPGVSTLLTNLLHTTEEVFSLGTMWENEYGYGTGNEMYTAVVGESPMFPECYVVGKSFTEVAEMAYHRHTAIPFAIIRAFTGQLMLNPGPKYKVALNDVIFYIALVSEFEMDIDEPEVDMETPQSYTTDDGNKNFDMEARDINHDYIDVLPGQEVMARLNLGDPPTPLQEMFKRKLGNEGSSRRERHEKRGKERAATRTRSKNFLAKNDLVLARPFFTPFFGALAPKCYFKKSVLMDAEKCEIDNLLERVKFTGVWENRPHIILTAKRATNSLFHFVTLMRSQNLKREHIIPIVLLLEEEPSDTFKESFVYFPDVVYLVGSPSSTVDLLRAGITVADIVIVTPSEEMCASNYNGDLESSDYLWDISTLMIVYKVQVEFPFVNTLSCLYHRRNLRFMKFFPGQKKKPLLSVNPTGEGSNIQLYNTGTSGSDASTDEDENIPYGSTETTNTESTNSIRRAQKKISGGVLDPTTIRRSYIEHVVTEATRENLQDTDDPDTDSAGSENGSPSPVLSTNRFQTSLVNEPIEGNEQSEMNEKKLVSSRSDGEDGASATSCPSKEVLSEKRKGAKSTDDLGDEPESRGQPGSAGTCKKYDYRRELRRQSSFGEKTAFFATLSKTPSSKLRNSDEKNLVSSLPDIKEAKGAGSRRGSSADSVSNSMAMLAKLKGKFGSKDVNSSDSITSAGPNISTVTGMLSSYFVMHRNPEDKLNQSKSAYAFKLSYASGLVFSIGLVESLIFQAFYKPDLIDLVRLTLNSVESKHSTSLHTIPLSSRFIKTFSVGTYGELVSFLTREVHVIPIGLYRQRRLRDAASSNDGPKMTRRQVFTKERERRSQQTFNERTSHDRKESIASLFGEEAVNLEEELNTEDDVGAKYPFTNPPSDVLLRSTDSVYVFGKQRDYNQFLYGEPTPL